MKNVRPFLTKHGIFSRKQTDHHRPAQQSPHVPSAARVFLSMLILSLLLTLLPAVSVCAVSAVSSARLSAADPDTDYLNGSHILFLSSYDPTFITVPLQQQGIMDCLNAYGIDCDVAYMDTKHYDDAENERLFYELLSYRFHRREAYDAVLLGDDAALLFAMKYRDELFAGIPMVFFCINDVARAEEAAALPGFTGFIEEFYLEDTLDIARTMQPEADTFLAIVDLSASGVGDEKAFYALQDRYPDIRFTHLNTSEHTHDEIFEQLEALDNHTIVLYMDAFSDADGDYFDIDEAAELLSLHCPVPVFRNSIGGVGDGLIGGKLVDYRACGYSAAQTVVRILDGEDIDSTPLVRKCESSYVFDWAVLSRFNLTGTSFPAGTTFVNRPVSFYERYRSVLLPAALIISALTLLLIAALLSGRSSRRYAAKLKESEESLSYRLSHDFLTDLPNRRSITEQLSREADGGRNPILLLFDLDDFKEINDSYGEACGDQILKSCAARLKTLEKDYGITAARYGGDAFLILCRDDRLSAEQLQHIVRDAMLSPFYYQNRAIPVLYSGGMVGSSIEETDPVERIIDADIALFAAKQENRGSIVSYQPDMKQSVHRSNEIHEILDRAVKEDAFKVLYQPKVDVKTREIVGYEALVRLTDASLSPAEFIPIAESTGQIITIDRIVTQAVIEQLAKWRDHGMTLHPVSINYSSRQTTDRQYVDDIISQLARFNLPADLIEIEMTESLFIRNSEDTALLFDRFRRAGIRLALDDFGTGYSSLSYLSYIPVDTVKLDKTMIDTYLTKEKGAFIRNIITMVHDFGMRLIAEGVESDWQVELLSSYGCDCIQGYYFSRPLDADAVESFRVN